MKTKLTSTEAENVLQKRCSGGISYVFLGVLHRCFTGIISRICVDFQNTFFLEQLSNAAWVVLSTSTEDYEFWMFMHIWDKLFKNRPSKICAIHPLKNFIWSILEYFVPYMEIVSNKNCRNFLAWKCHFLYFEFRFFFYFLVWYFTERFWNNLTK